MNTPKQEAERIFKQYYKLLFLCETTKSIGINCAIIDVRNTLKYIVSDNYEDIKFLNEVLNELNKM